VTRVSQFEERKKQKKKKKKKEEIEEREEREERERGERGRTKLHPGARASMPLGIGGVYRHSTRDEGKKERLRESLR